jgi:hypothetical protein
MKNTIKLPALGLMALIAFAGCKDKTKEIGDPSSKLQGINDVWVLEKVEQADPSDAEFVIDVTPVFTEGGAPELSINSSNFTYRFNVDDPIFIGTSGTWNFDDIAFPTRIDATHNGNTQPLKLLRTVRNVDQHLSFQLTRYCDGGTASTIYHFTFKRK